MRKYIRVIPSSSKNQIIESAPMIVRVKQPADKGKANQAVIKLLAKYYGKHVRIISGIKSRKKLVEIL